VGQELSRTLKAGGFNGWTGVPRYVFAVIPVNCLCPKRYSGDGGLDRFARVLPKGRGTGTKTQTTYIAAASGTSYLVRHPKKKPAIPSVKSITMLSPKHRIS